MACDQEKKRKSIGFSTLSLADEKIELIDIFSDDNDFLVAAHSISNSLQEKDYGQYSRLPPLGEESSRPSLAWDAAFFDSSGFLDQHELSIINQGFKTTSNKLKKVDCYPGSHKKCSRKEATVFSPSPAKALCRLRNSLIKPSKKDAKMEKKHTTPKSNSARFSYSSPGSCPIDLKRMAQSRKSTEMSQIWSSCSERTKLIPKSLPLATDKEPIVMDYNDAKEEPDSLQGTRDIFFSAAQLRPSRIRPPSPKIGFFDETTPLFTIGEPKTRRNTPRKVEPQETPDDILADSACDQKLERNRIKRLKGAHLDPPKATNVKEITSSLIKKRSEVVSPRSSTYDPFSSQGNGKKKACTDSGDQHGKLCRYFEAIDLKQNKQQQYSPASNKSRTPLAEKTVPSICDYSNTNLIWFGGK